MSAFCFAQTGSVSAADRAAPAYNVVFIRLNKTRSESACGIRRDLVYGITNWAESTHFDVETKGSGPDPAALKNLANWRRASILEPLLEERVHSKTHTETRTLPVFERIVLKKGRGSRRPLSPVTQMREIAKGTSRVA